MLIRNKPIRNIVPAALLLAAVSIAAGGVAVIKHHASIALDDQEYAAATDQVFRTFESRLAQRLNGLQFIAELAADGRIGDDERFDIAAAATHQNASGYLAINFIDADRKIVRVWPHEANAASLGKIVGQKPEILALIMDARASGLPHATGLVDLFQGGKGVATYFPIGRDGSFKGYINGVFRIDGLQSLLESTERTGIGTRIAVFETGDERALAEYSTDRKLSFLNKTIVVSFQRLTTHHSHSQEMVIFGLGVALAAAASMMLYASLSARSRSMRNESLLSSILTAAPDAVLSVDDCDRVQAFNPAAEVMFGCKASQVIGKDINRLLPSSLPAQHDRDENGQIGTGVVSSRRYVRGLRSDGSEFPVMASTSEFMFEGKRLSTAVLRDMTETELLNKELVRLAEEGARVATKAENASHAKSMFLASVSHELRTPLNAILGFSQMISSEPFGPLGHPKYHEYLEDIRSSGEHLLTIINDVLDITKIEVGSYELTPELFDLAALLRQTTNSVFPLALEKGQTVGQDIAPSLMAFADKRATRQVILNLLSNAIKFTAKGGAVKIGCQRSSDNRSVAFWITDNGPGIPGHILEKLGSPFVQERDPHYAGAAGTGLGVSISKSLVSGMNGRLTVASAMGVGTTVTVTLPGDAIQAAGEQASLALAG